MKQVSRTVAIRPLHTNRLFGALSHHGSEQLSNSSKLVSLRPGEILCDAGCIQRYVYFPNDAIVSAISITQAGKSAEIAVVGNEGVVGVDVVMGRKRSCRSAQVQTAGSAYRMPAQLLVDEFNSRADVRLQILGFIQSLFAQMAQMAVCNRHHAIEQQFCRRLLCLLDRAPGDELVLTQGMMASLLGVRREGVTDAVGKLRRLGVIESRRGRIRVLDRTRLEELSCECYAFVRSECEYLESQTRHPHPVMAVPVMSKNRPIPAANLSAGASGFSPGCVAH